LPIFIAILFVIPMLIVAKLGWRLVMAFWALLFVGSALIKLFGLVI
jgi:hypothetical protein